MSEIRAVGILGGDKSCLAIGIRVSEKEVYEGVQVCGNSMNGGHLGRPYCASGIMLLVFTT